MRVLHVVPTLNPAKGGPSKSVLGLATAQARAGAGVTIVAGATPGASPPVSQDEVDIRIAPLLTRSFAIPGPPFIAALRSAIGEADIVHLHSIWNGVITAANRLARSQGKPVLLSPRGMLDAHNIRRRGRMKKLYWKLVDASGVRALDGLHFLDETEREGASWAMRPDKPSIIQPNGLDLDQMQAQLKALGASQEARAGTAAEAQLLFLGRLNVIKGLEMQVELMADLRDAGLPARLHIIGPDDGERGGLLQLANGMGVADAIDFHGPIYGDERLRWLHEVDLVLMTSHYECNSNTAAEAMGVGGVLVATSTCNLHKAERTGAAVVVQRERAALRDAVIGILGDAEHAAGLRARALDFARDHLDWQPLGVDMLAFYETLAERRSSCAA